MSALDWIVFIVAAVVVLLSVGTVAVTMWWDFREWQRRRAKKSEVPALPSLKEIHAADMSHWDQRFYSALESALPDACNCDPYPFRCTIHQLPPERLKDVDTLKWRADYYREKQRARK